MKFMVALAALALDYYRPLARPSWIEDWLASRADWLHDHFNAGGRHHGWMAWVVGAVLPAAAAGMLAGILYALSPPLSWALTFAALYFAMGYRVVDKRARDIIGALSVLDLDRAKQLGGDWCGEAVHDVETMARDGIRTVLRLCLNRLFAPIFWFALLGLFGVMLYGLTRYLAQRWQADTLFGAAAARATHWLEWPAARVLALTFAIVGNFEHALAGWRALRAEADNESVVASAGSGAIGVRLGEIHGEFADSDPSRHWDAPGADYLEGALRLVWRALILWLAVLFFAWLAGR